MPNTFVIPKTIANWRLKSLPRSSSLSAVLRILRVRRMKDLAKLTHEDIRKVTSDADRFVLELTRLIENAASSKLREPEAKRRWQTTLVADEQIRVARAAWKIEVADLPLTVRLQGVLQRKGVRRLRELDGVAYCDLRRMDNCGRKTIVELRSILERVNAGDPALIPTPQEPANPAALLAQVDTLMNQLPARNRQILALRLGSQGEPPSTLEAIGRNYHMTRERVRQIVQVLPDKIRRAGGPRMRASLAALDFSDRKPLNQARLRTLAPKPWKFGYHPVFYLRLLTLLKPNLQGIRPD